MSNDCVVMKMPFGDDLKSVIALSRESAIKFGYPMIGIDNLLLEVIGLEKGSGATVLSKLLGDLNKVAEKIRNHRDTGLLEQSNGLSEEVVIPENSLVLTADAEVAVHGASEEAMKHGSAMVDSCHLVLSILRMSEQPVVQALVDMGVTYKGVSNCLKPGRTDQ